MPIQLAPTWHESKIPTGVAARASSTLAEVLDRYENLVRATWDVENPRDYNSDIVLTLQDDGAEVRGRFKQEELESPTEFRLRLRIMWANLLQKRANRQLETLVAAGG